MARLGATVRRRSASRAESAVPSVLVTFQPRLGHRVRAPVQLEVLREFQRAERHRTSRIPSQSGEPLAGAGVQQVRHRRCSVARLITWR
ncbi:hypothetical protein ANCCAN_04542 [Ancylostoma caninum]|uniref:Uncharacterized protein n=1 Tax=Ancylostoma caninum TaxID=29170 RepID=A0A368GY49_ANCCA|nr:hypothetical protein ANCCAN_04542 [Ancylostoma caninum]